MDLPHRDIYDDDGSADELPYTSNHSVETEEPHIFEQLREYLQPLKQQKAAATTGRQKTKKITAMLPKRRRKEKSRNGSNRLINVLCQRGDDDNDNYSDDDLVEEDKLSPSKELVELFDSHDIASVLVNFKARLLEKNARALSLLEADGGCDDNDDDKIFCDVVVFAPYWTEQIERKYDCCDNDQQIHVDPRDMVLLCLDEKSLHLATLQELRSIVAELCLWRHIPILIRMLFPSRNRDGQQFHRLLFLLDMKLTNVGVAKRKKSTSNRSLSFGVGPAKERMCLQCLLFLARTMVYISVLDGQANGSYNDDNRKMSYRNRYQSKSLVDKCGRYLTLLEEHIFRDKPTSMSTFAARMSDEIDDASNDDDDEDGDWNDNECASMEGLPNSQTERGQGQTKRREYGKIAKICPETNDVVEVFDSPNHVAQSYGHDSIRGVRHLYSVLNGERRLFNGFHWRGYPLDDKRRTGKGSSCRRKHGRIAKVCPTTDKIVAIYDSPSHVAKSLGNKKLNHMSRLYDVLNGKGKIFMGFHWRRYPRHQVTAEVSTRGSAATTIKPATPSKRIIEQVCAETGTVLATFSSTKEAATSFGKGGKAFSSVANALNGRTATCWGYKWRYRNCIPDSNEGNNTKKCQFSHHTDNDDDDDDGSCNNEDDGSSSNDEDYVEDDDLYSF